MAIATGRRLEKGVEKGIALLRARSVPPHRHGRRCAHLLGHVITENEETLFESKQSYLHTLTPGRVIATTRRIIIIRPSFFGLYLGHDLLSPTEYHIIPYKNIISVMLTKGRLLSTIHMRIHGFIDTMQAGNEGEVPGLRVYGAKLLANFLEEIIEYREEGELEGESAIRSAETGRAYTYGNDRSAKDIKEAKEIITQDRPRFIWLGIEPAEQVATTLGVVKEKVVRMNIEDITKSDETYASGFTDCIFVCYDGAMASRITKYLKERYNIDSYYLKHGIAALARTTYNMPLY